MAFRDDDRRCYSETGFQQRGAVRGDASAGKSCSLQVLAAAPSPTVVPLIPASVPQLGSPPHINTSVFLLHLHAPTPSDVPVQFWRFCAFSAPASPLAPFCSSLLQVQHFCSSEQRFHIATIIAAFSRVICSTIFFEDRITLSP